MVNTLLGLVILLWQGLFVYAERYEPKHDGIFGGITADISNCETKINTHFLLPYNPVIIEAGGYEGANTKNLAKRYPKGRIFVFEPNPRAFKVLLENTENDANVSVFNLALNTFNGTCKLYLNHGVYCDNPDLEKTSSLLEERSGYPYFKGPVIDVPCTVLGDWCEENGVSRVDFIRLDVEGMELQIIKSSPQIFEKALVVCTKTHFFLFRKETAQFFELKSVLEKLGFEMISHWYREGVQGEAIFLKKYIFDALYR